MLSYIRAVCFGSILVNVICPYHFIACLNQAKIKTASSTEKRCDCHISLFLSLGTTINSCLYILSYKVSYFSAIGNYVSHKRRD